MTLSTFLFFLSHLTFQIAHAALTPLNVPAIQANAPVTSSSAEDKLSPEAKARELYDRGTRYVIENHWKRALKTFSRIDKESINNQDLLYRITFNSALAELGDSIAYPTATEKRQIEGRAGGIWLQLRSEQLERSRIALRTAANSACKLPRNQCEGELLAQDWAQWAESARLQQQALLRTKTRETLIPLRMVGELMREAQLLQKWEPTLYALNTTQSDDIALFAEALSAKMREFSLLWKALTNYLTIFPLTSQEQTIHRNHVIELIRDAECVWNRWMERLAVGDFLGARPLGIAAEIEIDSLFSLFTEHDVLESSLEQRVGFVKTIENSKEIPNTVFDREVLSEAYHTATKRSEVWLKALAAELLHSSKSRARSMGYELAQLSEELVKHSSTADFSLSFRDLMAYRLLINELGSCLESLRQLAQAPNQIQELRRAVNELRHLLSIDIARDSPFVEKAERSQEVLDALNRWVDLDDTTLIQEVVKADALRPLRNRLQEGLSDCAIATSLLLAEGIFDPKSIEDANKALKELSLLVKGQVLNEPLATAINRAVKEIPIDRQGYESAFFWSWIALDELVSPLNNTPLAILRRVLLFEAHAIDSLALSSEPNALLKSSSELEEAMFTFTQLDTIAKTFPDAVRDQQKREYANADGRCRAELWQEVMQAFYRASENQQELDSNLSSEPFDLKHAAISLGEAFSHYLQAYQLLRGENLKETPSDRPLKSPTVESSADQLRRFDILNHQKNSPPKLPPQREERPW